MFQKEFNLPGGVVNRRVRRSIFQHKRFYVIFALFCFVFYFFFFNTTDNIYLPKPINNEDKINENLQVAGIYEVVLPTKTQESDVITSTAETKEVSVKDRVEDIINNYKVAIFSKSYCPFCRKAKEILLPKTKNIFVLELDDDDQGEKIQKYLYNKTKRSTVPNIFINKKNIGGSDDLQELVDKDELNALFEE